MILRDEPVGEYSRMFRHDGANNILLEKDLGLANGHITVGTPYGAVCSVAGLYAPPYVSSDFDFDLRLFGEKLKTVRYVWYPNMLFREGCARGCAVASGLFLLKGRRAAVMRISIENKTASDVNVPMQAMLAGGVDYVHDWTFSKPIGNKDADLRVEPRRLVKRNNDKYVIVGASIDGMSWFGPGNMWEGALAIRHSAAAVIYFHFCIGGETETAAASRLMFADPAACIIEAQNDLEERAGFIFTRLPRFTSDNTTLQNFYYRSLVHYLTNEWRVDEFIVNPYFSTGSINGGCVCSYLWDFSAGWELHALYKPNAFKEQIKIFLGLDLTKCFAFLPVNGNPNGPWYPVNQEKIVGLVYYHVLITGDASFLQETVNGRTVLDIIIENATHGVKPGEPLMLFDYGIDGEHHLELRRGLPYHGVLPDLNARRHKAFIWAAALCRLAGRTADARLLLSYANEMKALVREQLWCGEKRWFWFINNGVKDIRLTVQMFKLADSGVLDDDMLDGLLSHLNEDEFLSEYGLHSMSKTDPAYDQIDIDNGGGGNCCIFPTLIIEKLYTRGRAAEADDIFRRILWWGDCLPYWGDSMVANYIDYRQDTPLQCTIGGVTGAQCVIFGMMGVSIGFDGTVTVNPHLPAFAGDARLDGLRIGGKVIDIHCERQRYTVIVGGETIVKSYGEPAAIR